MSEIVPLEVVSGLATQLQEAAETNVETAAYLANGQAVRKLCAEAPQHVRRASLPQLPDSEVLEVYDRIVLAEAQVVGTAETLRSYGEGTARQDDELLVVTRTGSVLMEAQHATDPVRKATGKRGGADHGTGGLGLVVAQDIGGSIVVPLGRQTGNANVKPQHPIKDELARLAAAGSYDRFFSVHGCVPGKVVNPALDRVEIHGVIGLGLNPSEADYERADALRIRAARELGLRVVVGNVQPHVNFAKDPDWDGVSFWDRSSQLKTNDAGEVVAENLAALMPHSTVNFMREQTQLPATQLEISRSLRLTPTDVYRRDTQAERYGVYMGYQLCRMAAEA